MRTAIFSDIHGNLEALEAVLADLDGRTIDTVMGLGDLIGYGPDPDGVVEVFRSRGFASVVGNHEAALGNPRMRQWLNFQARENSLMTEKLLSEPNRQYCSALPANLIQDNSFFVHGFPPDSVLQYATMKSPMALKKYFSSTSHPFCFVGHTHELAIISWDGKRLETSRPGKGIHQLDERCMYIINAGSVGQPRDGSKCAKYLIWDNEKHRLEIVHVGYDTAITVAKIKARGFPDAYGLRLS